VVGCLKSPVARLRVAIVIAVSMIAIEGAGAQNRRRAPEVPPKPLPTISEDAARCSIAYREALQPLAQIKTKQLGDLDRLARTTDPNFSGKWIYWVKAGRRGQAMPQEQRVCAEKIVRGGRERCLQWETKPADPDKLALFAAQPSADEALVLRVVDPFASDRGAALEFGSNGRQFATYQRVALELATYVEQPRNAALCAGVPEMLEFKATKLEGLAKRAADVNANAAKALALAKRRVATARAQRGAIGLATDPQMSAQIVAPTVAPTTATDGAVASAKTSLEVLLVLLDGLLPIDQIAKIRDGGTTLRALARVSEFIQPDALPDVTPVGRSALLAALRMIEASAYGEAQAVRVRQFDRLLFGTLEDIRDAHRATCTCGG
jgi:hypothetical protein